MCDSASSVESDAACRTLPATCSGRSRVSGKTAQAFSSVSPMSRSLGAVEPEHLGRCDDADQTPQVVAVGDEIVGEHLQGRRQRRARLQVVDRLDQRLAEHQRPDAIDRGPGEVRVLRVRHPGGELVAAAALRRAAAPERTARCGSTTRFVFVLRSSASYSPSPSWMPVKPTCVWPKNAARPWKSVCFQSANGWLWHWAQSSRMPRKARVTRPASRTGSGWFLLSCLNGDGDEIGRRVIGPQSFAGDQLADHLIVGPILPRSARPSQVTNRRRR